MPISQIRFRMVSRRAHYYLSISCKDYPPKNMLFEFGGHMMTSLFWNIWLDRIYRLEGFYYNKSPSNENQTVHEIFRADCDAAEESDFPFLRSYGSESSLQEAQFHSVAISKIQDLWRPSPSVNDLSNSILKSHGVKLKIPTY